MHAHMKTYSKYINLFRMLEALLTEDNDEFSVGVDAEDEAVGMFVCVTAGLTVSVAPVGILMNVSGDFEKWVWARYPPLMLLSNPIIR